MKFQTGDRKGIPKEGPGILLDAHFSRAGITSRTEMEVKPHKSGTNSTDCKKAKKVVTRNRPI